MRNIEVNIQQLGCICFPVRKTRSSLHFLPRADCLTLLTFKAFDQKCLMPLSDSGVPTSYQVRQLAITFVIDSTESTYGHDQ